MRSLFLIIFSILILPTSIHAEGKRIKIIAEEWPPYSYKENDSIRGFSIEIVEQLISDTGIKPDGKAEIWPWARALNEIKKAPNILVATMHLNEERKNLFNWIGPICPREIWLYKLTNREDIVLQSLEDAEKYQVGVVRKSSSADYLIKNGFIESINLQLTTLEIQNIKKLIAGRIDLVPFNKAEMAWHLKKLTPPATLQMVTPAFIMSSGSQYFIALSKQVPNPIIVKLQKALDQMKQDGRYRKIWQKYME